jgi:small subunit ribosomal protein S16
VVKLRFKRFGRTHHPVYRLNAIDQRSPRDGRPIEQLGTYDPANQDESIQFSCNEERVKYWLSVGAQPSETVAAQLKKAGVMEAAKKA